MSVPTKQERNWFDRYIEGIKGLAEESPDDYLSLGGMPIGVNPKRLLDPKDLLNPIGMAGSAYNLVDAYIGRPIQGAMLAPVGAMMRAVGQLPDKRAINEQGQEVHRAPFSDKPEVPFEGNQLDPANYADYASRNLDQTFIGQVAKGVFHPTSLIGGPAKGIGLGIKGFGEAAGLARTARVGAGIAAADMAYDAGVTKVGGMIGQQAIRGLRQGERIPGWGPIQQHLMDDAPSRIRGQFAQARAGAYRAIDERMKEQGGEITDLFRPGSKVKNNLPKGTSAWKVLQQRYVENNNVILGMTPERQVHALQVLARAVDSDNVIQTRSAIERMQLSREFEQLQGSMTPAERKTALFELGARNGENYERQAASQYQVQTAVKEALAKIESMPVEANDMLDPVTAKLVKDQTATAVEQTAAAARHARRIGQQVRGGTRIDPQTGMPITIKPIWDNANWHTNIEGAIAEDSPYRVARQAGKDAIQRARDAAEAAGVKVGESSEHHREGQKVFGDLSEVVGDWQANPLYSVKGVGDYAINTLAEDLQDSTDRIGRAAKQIYTARESVRGMAKKQITDYLLSKGVSQTDIDAQLPDLLKSARTVLTHDAFVEPSKGMGGVLGKIGLKQQTDLGRTLSKVASRYDQFGDLFDPAQTADIMSGRVTEMYKREVQGIRPTKRGILIPGVGMTALDELHRVPGLDKVGLGLDQQWMQEAVGKLNQYFLEQGETPKDAGKQAAMLAANPQAMMQHPVARALLMDDLRTAGGIALGTWKEQNLIAGSYHFNNLMSIIGLGAFAKEFGAQSVSPAFLLKTMTEKMKQLAKEGKIDNSIPEAVSEMYVKQRGNITPQNWLGAGESGNVPFADTGSATSRIPPALRAALWGGVPAVGANMASDRLGLSDEDKAKVVGTAGVLGALWGLKVPHLVKANYLAAGAMEYPARMAAGVTAFEAERGLLGIENGQIVGHGSLKRYVDDVGNIVNINDVQPIGQEMIGPTPLPRQPGPSAVPPAPAGPVPAPAPAAAAAVPPVKPPPAANLGPLPADFQPSRGHVGVFGPYEYFQRPDGSLVRADATQALDPAGDRLGPIVAGPDQADTVIEGLKERLGQRLPEEIVPEAVAPEVIPEAAPAAAAAPAVDPLAGPPTSDLVSAPTVAILVDQAVDNARRLGLVDVILTGTQQDLDAALDARRITMDSTTSWDDFNRERKSFWAANETRARQQLYEGVHKRVEILGWQQPPAAAAPAEAAAAVPEAAPAAAAEAAPEARPPRVSSLDDFLDEGTLRSDIPQTPDGFIDFGRPGLVMRNPRTGQTLEAVGQTRRNPITGQPEALMRSSEQGLLSEEQWRGTTILETLTFDAGDNLGWEVEYTPPPSRAGQATLPEPSAAPAPAPPSAPVTYYPDPLVTNRRNGGQGIDIGRPRGGGLGDWGNPYKVNAINPKTGQKIQQGEAVQLYADYIVGQPEKLARVGELRGQQLKCWCAPLPCHGHVLARLANELDTSLPPDQLMAEAKRILASPDPRFGATTVEQIDAALPPEARQVREDIDPNAPGSFAASMGDEVDDIQGEAQYEARAMAGEFDEPGRYDDQGMFDDLSPEDRLREIDDEFNTLAQTVLNDGSTPERTARLDALIGEQLKLEQQMASETMAASGPAPVEEPSLTQPDEYAADMAEPAPETMPPVQAPDPATPTLAESPPNVITDDLVSRIKSPSPQEYRSLLIEEGDRLGLDLRPHLGPTLDVRLEALRDLGDAADQPVRWLADATPDGRPSLTDMLEMEQEDFVTWANQLDPVDVQRVTGLRKSLRGLTSKIIDEIDDAVANAQQAAGLTPGGAGTPPPPAAPGSGTGPAPDPDFTMGPLRTEQEVITARRLARQDMRNAPGSMEEEDYISLGKKGPKIQIGKYFNEEGFKTDLASERGHLSNKQIYDLALEHGASPTQAARLRARWDEDGWAAEQKGYENVRDIHVDYEDINNLTHYLKMGPMPFLTWGAKAIPKYLSILAHHPGLLLAMSEYSQASDQEIEEAGLPASFRNFAEQGGLVNAMASAMMGREGAAYANPMGGITPYSDLGKEQSDYSTPTDRVFDVARSLGFGPSPLITLPTYMTGLTGDMPVNMLRNSPLMAGAIHALTGHAADPEALPKAAARAVRQAVAPGDTQKTVTGDPIKDYYVRKRISSMAAEAGHLPTGEYLRAIQDAKGPIWDSALWYVEREMAGRTAMSWAAPVRWRLVDKGEQAMRDAQVEHGITAPALEELNRQPLTRADLQYAAASLARKPLAAGETLEERAKDLRVSRQFSTARAEAPISGGLSGLGADPRSEARRAQLLEQESRHAKPISAKARASRDRAELKRGEALLREMNR